MTFGTFDAGLSPADHPDTYLAGKTNTSNSRNRAQYANANGNQRQTTSASDREYLYQFSKMQIRRVVHLIHGQIAD